MYVDFRDAQEFVARCQALAPAEGEILLVCLANQSASELDRIVELLSQTSIPFAGAIFPALIHDGAVRQSGAVVQVHPLVAGPTVVRIDNGEVDLTRPLPAVPVSRSKATCLVLADFSCVAVAALLEALFNRHGNVVNYFGAGAGTGDRKPSPVVFTSEGRFSGAALVTFLGSQGEVHLRHGWSRASDPVVATRTEGNVIKELNWEPAMSVYRNLVGDQVADSLTRKEDVPSAKRHPFGIAREDLEDVVRDPLLSTADGELVVLSDVPEHSVMRILEAEPERLIAAAGELAADFACRDDAAQVLLFDCYSRAMLLDRAFPEEISVFARGLRSRLSGCTVEGALALGEIASDGERLPDFHNKTMAAGVFYVGP